MDIIYITDPKILAVPIVECGEPLVDIKNYSDLLYGPPPECELTVFHYTKMRESVFERLCAAQKELPKAWRFRLYEGFRTISVQKMLFDQEYERMRARFPDKNQDFLFQETTRLVSPVINCDGSSNIPAHNTGGAIDIEVLIGESELLDMGMTAKSWVLVDPDLCLTKSPLINPGVQHNRHFLCDLMQAYGFINYPTEWWHFSYGDRYWAYHKKMQQAIYGSADSVY